MRNALATWKWSLLVTLRSPLAVLVLAIVAALWGFGAYEWLWFPSEASVPQLLVGAVWLLALFVVLAGFVTASITNAQAIAVEERPALTVHRLSHLSLHQIVNCMGFLVVAGLLALVIYVAFDWINYRALEVASFLTFRSERAVAPETVERVFRFLQSLLWVAASGFLLSFVSATLQRGWRAAARAVPQLLANACWRATFLTTCLSLIAFGGVSYLLATWHPKVSAGFSDYAQATIRLGVGLLWSAIGWLFWILSVIRSTATARDLPPA
jgi:hypothetical protein